MLRLSATLLAVPVVSFWLVQGVLYKSNSDWHASVQRQIDEGKAVVPAEMLQLQTVCSTPQLSDMWPKCRDVRALTFISCCSIGGALVGMALVGFITLAGIVCRSRRRLLLALFGTGLRATVLILMGLIFLHAALAIGSVYYAEGEFLGERHFGIAVATIIGALAAVVGVVRGLVGIVQTATIPIVGTRYELSASEDLAEVLRHLTKTIGTSMPDNVVVGFTPTFFVTEAQIKCLDGSLLTGRTLYISLPLARILRRTEMAAVLAHEFSHFTESNAKFSQSFYPIYKGTAQSLAKRVATLGKGAQRTTLALTMFTVSYFYKCFAPAEAGLRCKRELEADAAGAQATTPRLMAIALLKVCAFASSWNTVYERMRLMSSQEAKCINVSADWAHVINTIKDRSVFDALGEYQLDHPTDFHPPLSARLDALQLSVSTLAADALHTAPADTAVELIAGHETLERELTAVVDCFLRENDMQGVSNSAALSLFQ